MSTTGQALTLEVPVAELRSALKLLKPLVSKSFYDAVRLRSNDDGFMVDAWQGEAAARVKLDDIPGAALDVTVPLPVLDQALAQSSAAEVTFSIAGNDKTKRLQLVLGQRHVAIDILQRVEMPDTDFEPKDAKPLLKSGFWQQSSLSDLFTRVSTHAGVDETRPLLQALLLDEYNVVTTDSFRLACLDLPAYDVDCELPLKETVTVSALYLAMACRACAGELEIAHTDRHVFVSGEQTSWMIRKSDGQFPQWRKLVPEAPEFQVEAKLDRRSTLEAANAFAGLLRASRSRDARPVRLVAHEDTLEFEATTDAGTSIEQVPWSPGQKPVLRDPEPFGLNPLFLADALKILEGEEVMVEVISPLRPVILRGLDGFVLLMPIRLGA